MFMSVFMLFLSVYGEEANKYSLNTPVLYCTFPLLNASVPVRQCCGVPLGLSQGTDMVCESSTALHQ